MKWTEIAIFPAIVVFVAAILLISQNGTVPERQNTYSVPEHIPDFASYNDVNKKKKAFFEFMLPKIRKTNEQIKQERNEIKDLLTKMTEGKSLSKADKEKLAATFKNYGLGVPDSFTPSHIQNLLERVDIVPASLVLAQAANESAWGTSRFARRANNFFGIWCFTPGCGLTPKRRDSGKTHEVRKYDTIQAGVNHYMHLINTRRAYRELRGIRAELRNEDNINGLALAEGLLRYSERGPAYVRELQQMIRYNNLHEYTLDYSA